MLTKGPWLTNRVRKKERKRERKRKKEGIQKGKFTEHFYWILNDLLETEQNVHTEAHCLNGSRPRWADLVTSSSLAIFTDGRRQFQSQI